MIIDSKGKLFEERRKKERRKNEFNTKEEIDYCIGQLKELLPVLRKYVRR